MPSRPNILLLNTHDSGRQFGCYGVDEVQTPNVDRLAESGVKVTDFHATVPQCAPSRCSMTTGLYPQHHGMMGIPGGAFGWTLNEDVPHLAGRLSEGGYRTALFGIQHEVRPKHLKDIGFDVVDEGSRPGPELGGDVASFIEEYDREEPFYAQVGFFETHEPLDFGDSRPDDENGVAVPNYLADEPETREYLAQFQGLLRQCDRGVGRILDALDDAGLRESTLVVFTSDHGIPFSRAKGYLYDAGTGIPLLLRWPDGGLDGGRTTDLLASNVDFVPTLLDLVNLPVPDDIDGRSFSSMLRSDKDSSNRTHRDAVFGMFHDHRRWGFGPDARSVRTDRYKLIRNFESGAHFDLPIDLSTIGRTGRASLKSDTRPMVELYDLDEDPDEFDNRAEDPEYADIRETLENTLRGHLAGLDDPILEGPPMSPFARGALDEFTSTQ